MGYEKLYQPKSAVIIGQQGEVIDTADSYDPLGGISVYNEMQTSIHRGESFGFSAYGTLAIGASSTLIGRVTSKEVHFDGMSIDLANGGVLLEFIEAPTVSVLGTAQSARRKNRAIANTATMGVYSGATITGGTLVFSSLPPLVSGQGNSKIESSTAIEDGWVLKRNTDYAIRLTNQSGIATAWNASFGWHESNIILEA